jgi:hypothetical protein
MEMEKEKIHLVRKKTIGKRNLEEEEAVLWNRNWNHRNHNFLTSGTGT